jgi:hypothetical protein
MEFIFTKEYSKMLSPVFSGNYDFDAKEENGAITITLTPTSDIANIETSNDTSQKQG